MVAALFALGAAACFAVTFVLQHSAVRQAVGVTGGPRRALRRVLSQPVWWVAGCVDVAGVSLHVTALHAGPVAEVQPMLVAVLLAAIPAQYLLRGVRPTRREVGAALVCAGGLAVLLTAVPARDAGGRISGGALAAALGATGALVVATVGNPRVRRWQHRPVVDATLAGLCFGIVAVLLKALTPALLDHPLGLFGAWPFYALLIVALVGFVLSQTALAAHRLPAPLAAITVANPICAVAVGVGVLGEHLTLSGWRIATAVVAAGVVFAAVGILSRQLVQAASSGVRPEASIGPARSVANPSHVPAGPGGKLPLDTTTA